MRRFPIRVTGQAYYSRLHISVAGASPRFVRTTLTTVSACSDRPVNQYLSDETRPFAHTEILLSRQLKRYKYPPDKEEEATETVRKQAKLLSADWVAG